MQHMIIAAELLGPLHGNQILGFLNHTDDGIITGFVLADPARIHIRYVAATGAIMKIALDVHQGLGKIKDIFFLHIQHVKGEAPSRFGSDAGKAGERIDQFR